MTATPTPLRDTIGHMRDIADVAERYTVEELRDVLREKADELEATLSARDAAGAVALAELPAKMAYDIDPDTGADRGSCCGHAYADGWNDCIEAVRRVPATPPASGEAGADTRRFRGVGELERTGYLPEGTAAEREATPPAASVIDQMRDIADVAERYSVEELRDVLREQARRLAAVAPAGMDGWIPVSERLPEYGEWITGRTAEGATWEEEFDPEEPLGRMTAWRPRLRTAREIKHPTPPATAGQE